MLNFNRVYSAEEKETVRREAIEAVRYMQELSRQNGNSEMTLEEINEIIAETRREMREREKCR